MDEEELLACASCFTSLALKEELLEEKSETRKEVVYPYELTVCDRDCWCYSATHGQDRYDIIRTRPGGCNIKLLAGSSEMSWFPGYAWRIAHCECCEQHIGWGFCEQKPSCEGRPPAIETMPKFMGLILTRLRPSSAARAQEKAQKRQTQHAAASSTRTLLYHAEGTYPMQRVVQLDGSRFRRGPLLESYEDAPYSVFWTARSPTPPLQPLRGPQRAPPELTPPRPLRQHSPSNTQVASHTAQVMVSTEAVHDARREQNEAEQAAVVQVQTDASRRVHEASPRQSQLERGSGEERDGHALSDGLDGGRTMGADESLLRWLRRLFLSRQQTEPMRSTPLAEMRTPEPPRTPRLTSTSRGLDETTENNAQLVQRLLSLQDPAQQPPVRMDGDHIRTWEIVREASNRQRELADARNLLLARHQYSTRSTWGRPPENPPNDPQPTQSERGHLRSNLQEPEQVLTERQQLAPQGQVAQDIQPEPPSYWFGPSTAHEVRMDNAL